MATKSFLKNVKLRNKRDCQDFIRALENSIDAQKEVTEDRPQIIARDMDKATIRKIFVSGESE